MAHKRKGGRIFSARIRFWLTLITTEKLKTFKFPDVDLISSAVLKTGDTIVKTEIHNSLASWYKEGKKCPYLYRKTTKRTVGHKEH